MNSPRSSGRSGFTLVELLVVIAIIGVLVGLLLPAVQSAREAARRMSCSNNLKQFGLAMHNYHDTYNKFPYGHIYQGTHNPGNARAGGNAFGWGYSILPQMEQGALFDQFDARYPLAVGPDDIPGVFNKELAKTALATFTCPSDPKEPNRRDGAIPDSATSSYQAASGSYNGWGGSNALRRNGVFNRNTAGGPFGFKDITDGSSNQLLICEAHWGADRGNRNRGRIYGALDRNSRNNRGLFGAWGATNATMVTGEHAMNWSSAQGNPQPHRTAFSTHPGGAQFTFGDGSVKFIAETIQHTAHSWPGRTWRDNVFDRSNKGVGYGLYQRLFSRNDDLVVSNL